MRLNKININISFVATVTLVVIVNIMMVSHSCYASLEKYIDEWIDPELYGKKDAVKAVVKKLKENDKIPEKDKGEDFGYSFAAGTRYDYICLSMIQSMKKSSGKRVPVVDLGCGHGKISTLAVLAGGKVDAVDFREVVSIANKTIFTNTKKIFEYSSANANNFYRAFPQSLIAEKTPTWTQTPHSIGICNNVVHFFTESQIKIFAQRVYDNILPDGAFFVQADAPFYNKRALEFYTQRKGKVLCPGLAVYTKRKGKSLSVVVPPTPFTQEIEQTNLKPGMVYHGKYIEGGESTLHDDYYHNVKNLFMVEDLAHIFAQVGFKPIKQFYMDNCGRMILAESSAEIHTATKACVLFVKPPQ